MWWEIGKTLQRKQKPGPRRGSASSSYVILSPTNPTAVHSSTFLCGPSAKGQGGKTITIFPIYCLSIVIPFKAWKAFNCTHETPFLSSLPELPLFLFLGEGGAEVGKAAYLKVALKWLWKMVFLPPPMIILVSSLFQVHEGSLYSHFMINDPTKGWEYKKVKNKIQAYLAARVT